MCTGLDWVQDSRAIFHDNVLSVFVVVEAAKPSVKNNSHTMLDGDQTVLHGDSLEAELLQHLARSLPAWYRPDRVVILTSPLPVTCHGQDICVCMCVCHL